MEELKAIEALGFAMPSPIYLFGLLLFSVIGYAAYRRGKKTSAAWTMWLGVAIMLYPYLVSETWQLYSVGAVLCAALYLTRAPG